MPEFHHEERYAQFLAEPGQHIDAAITIENGGASTAHYRLIGAAKVDWAVNYIYFDIFDKTGQLINPVTVTYNWKENSNQTPLLVRGEKPRTEPSGNIAMVPAHIWVEVADFISERAVFPLPSGPSWYICFQLVDSTAPPPPPPPGEEKPPAVPIDLKAESATDKSVTLTWRVSDQLAAGFKVFWSKDLVTWPSLTSQIMRATVPDLLPDTLYTFLVYAINQHGESAPAEIQQRTTKTSEPPPPPMEDEVGKVLIHWGTNDRLVIAHKSALLSPDRRDETRSHLEIHIPLTQLLAMVDYCQKQSLEEIILAVNLVHPIL